MVQTLWLYLKHCQLSHLIIWWKFLICAVHTILFDWCCSPSCGNTAPDFPETLTGIELSSVMPQPNETLLGLSNQGG